MISTTLEQKGTVSEELEKPSFDTNNPKNLKDLITLAEEGENFPEFSDPNSAVSKEAARRRLAKGINLTEGEIAVYMALADYARESIPITDYVHEKANAEKEAQGYDAIREKSEIQLGNLDVAMEEIEIELNSLPQVDKEALLNIVQTEARIIERIAQGRAVWRYLVKKPDIDNHIKMELGRALNSYLETRGKHSGNGGTDPMNELLRRGVEGIRTGQIETIAEDYKLAEKKYREFLKAMKERIGEFPKATAETLADQRQQVAIGAAPNKPINTDPVL